MNVPESAILGQLGTTVDAIRITEDLAAAIAEALNETHRQAQAARDRELASFRRDLELLEGREDEVYDDLKRGLLDDAGYRRQLERVRAERRRFTDHLEAAQRGVLDGRTIRYDLKKPFRILSEMRESKEWRGRCDDFGTAILEIAA